MEVGKRTLEENRKELAGGISKRAGWRNIRKDRVRDYRKGQFGGTSESARWKKMGNH